MCGQSFFSARVLTTRETFGRKERGGFQHARGPVAQNHDILMPRKHFKEYYFFVKASKHLLSHALFRRGQGAARRGKGGKVKPAGDEKTPFPFQQTLEKDNNATRSPSHISTRAKPQRKHTRASCT